MNYRNTFIVAACAATTCLFNSLSAFGVEAETIEAIEVVGHHNSLLITAEIDLSQSSTPDMRGQLQTLPGLHINGNGAISGVLQYRGLFGDRMRINIDGAEIAGAGPNAMDSPLSHVMGTLYQQVTLHQGIAPVSVGAETIAGALEVDEYQFAINSQDTWQTQGGLTGQVSHNDNRAISALLFSSANNRYISVSADVQKAENYVSGDGDIVPSTFYERAAIKLKAGLQHAQHRFDITLGKRDTNASGTPALAMDILFVDALWYRLSHQYQYNDQWLVQTQMFGNHNEHDMNNFTLRTAPMPTMFRLNAVTSDALGIESKAMYEVANKEFEIGAEVFQRDHSSFISNPNNSQFFINNFNDIERDRISAYIQYSQNLATWDWEAGVRLSQVNQKTQAVSTNMAMMNPNVKALQSNFNNAERDLDFSLIDVVTKVNIPLDKNMTVHLSAGVKERAPTYSELFTWFPLGVSAGLADGRNYIGNLELDKETAYKLDVGLTMSDVDWSFVSRVFYSQIDDYIVGMPSTNISANNIAMMNGIPNPLQWNNTDATLAGFDTHMAIQLTNHWALHSTIEYVRGKYTSSDSLNQSMEQDLYRLAPLTGSVRVVYGFDKWQWQVNLRAVAAQNKVAEGQNETPTSGYGLLNTSIEYELNEQLSFTLLAENLLEKQYADHLAGINRVREASIPMGAKLPGAGRNIGLFAQYQF